MDTKKRHILNFSSIKLCFSAICLFVIITTPYAQKSPKRGMAYGYHTVEDLDAVSPGVSWWYNWSSSPDAGVASYYQSQGVEFVPMIWGGSFDVNTVIANIKPDAKYLLAFNEPNFNVESNLTPQQAVDLWPQIEQIAAAKNLEIISASAAYCGGSVCISGYTSPITWHDEFFSLCPTCKVDYIAFHTYEPTVGGAKSLTDNLKKYGRPIWVTEFANYDSGQLPADKIDYLQQLVDLYENDPDIYRYSWFTGRSGSNSSINILGANGALTALGSAYINRAYGPVYDIPGYIEAESLYRRKGISDETTTDVGGGKNIGWFDPWDWGEYLVGVAQEGYYNFYCRVASFDQTGKFHLQLDDSTITSAISFAPTGGYQTWTTIIVNNVPLKQGEHLLKLVSEASGFNINYFNTSYTGPLATSKTLEESVSIYPNPVSDNLRIEFKNVVSPDQLQVLDLNGKVIMSFNKKEIPESLSLKELADGVYCVHIRTADQVFNKRIVKK